MKIPLKRFLYIMYYNDNHSQEIIDNARELLQHLNVKSFKSKLAAH